MGKLWPLLVFLLLLSPSVGHSKEGEGLVSLKALQGTWKCLWHEGNGVKAEQTPTDARLVIQGDQWNWGNYWKCKLVLDPATSPAVVDLDYNGRPYEGICRLDGNKLMFCWKGATGTLRIRPAEFKTSDGDGYQVIVFEREK